jgi:predicted histone-like DNA-binding protein
MGKILYQLRKQNNEELESYGNYFAKARRIHTLTTREFADHIASHGSVFTSAVVFGVIEEVRKCLTEMVCDSKAVKLDGFGTFYATIENRKGGYKPSDKETVFSPVKYIEGLHLRFLPDGQAESNLTSKELRKTCQFVDIESLVSGETEGDLPGDNDTNNTQGGTTEQGGNSNSGSQGGTQSGGNTNTDPGPDNGGGGNGGTSDGDDQ